MWLLLLIIPFSEPITDRCDRCEYNHYYDENGSHVFDQIIFYEWDGEFFSIVDHFVFYGETYPTFSKSPYGDRVIFHHRESKKLHVVTVGETVETWTQYDPEIRDKYLRQYKRRGLRRTP